MIEKRTFNSEVRMVTQGERRVIEGHAAVFERWSNPLHGGTFTEQVKRGFFDGREGDDVRGLLNHDINFVLGRTASQTMRISIDDSGLYYEIDSPDTSYARDLEVSLERGDISQSSFSFDVELDRWYMEDGAAKRDLIKASRLYDVGPVTFPAYEDADSGIAHRSLLIDELKNRGGVDINVIKRLQGFDVEAGQEPKSTADEERLSQAAHEYQKRRISLVRTKLSNQEIY